ncbi:hypothetical protein WJU23_23015 [Prosthecobacter sp. SYSU 5D2]|uniref:hypothetical protein n=1 Tax=Prosthecobacter sp. SYSU 5D2 TaxID=3134134 RepID=UPI0031FE4ADB
MTLSAQDREFRSNGFVFGRKPDTRNFNVSRHRPKAPPPVRKIRWVPSASINPAAATAAPQRYLASTQFSAGYETAAGRYNQEVASRSSISILPNGTVVTQEGYYQQPMVTENGLPLNEFDLAPPTLSVHEIQYRNSALVPPPPPVQKSSRTSAAKPDLDKVKTAEKVSPGLAKSPYPPHSLLDIQGMRSGSLAEDPASRKVFRVP